jgi:hypothetical protein
MTERNTCKTDENRFFFFLPPYPFMFFVVVFYLTIVSSLSAENDNGMWKCGVVLNRIILRFMIGDNYFYGISDPNRAYQKV